MANLQTHQGKGKHTGKTFYRIQPVLPNGKRPTIRLGTGRKGAEKSLVAIQDLIESFNHCVEPSATTKAWVELVASESVCNTLLKHELIDTLPERLTGVASSDKILISQLADDYIRTRGADQDANTITIYLKGKRNLIDCFGDVDIRTLQAKDGREFWRWLIEEGSRKAKKDETKGLATNTAKQRLRTARGFFEQAIEDNYIAKNPFKAGGLKTTQSAAEKKYIAWGVVKDTIAQCPTLEWQLLFALVRTIPTRVPSEIRELTWADVDVEKNTLLLHSPKTRVIGKSARLVPLLEPFKSMLAALRDRAFKCEQYVFPSLRLNKNLATTAKKYVSRAGHQVWSNFFNSLRASAETDLMDEYGLRKACQWAGNSATTAMKNYALVRKNDFADEGIAVPNTTHEATHGDAFDAQSDAVPASTVEPKTSESTKKAALPRTVKFPRVQPMGVEGLEPPTLSV